MITEIVELTI